jgi:hypothetical protein
MARLKCKADEKLFNELVHIVGNVSFVSGIVQNDMIITTKELHEWEAAMDREVQHWLKEANALLVLKSKVFEHIKNCNKKG